MPAPAVSYLVCTTQRTGSNFLCSLLSGTGRLGMRPHPAVGTELALRAIIGHDYELPTRRHTGLVFPASADEVREFVTDCFRESMTPNGVAGWKLMDDHARRLETFAGGTSMVDLLPEGCRFIFLSRRDVVAQAVSTVRAIQTGCWTSGAQAAFRGMTFFDPHSARNRIGSLQAANDRWRSRLADAEQFTLEVTYEDLLGDPKRVLTDIAAFLDIELEEDFEIFSRHRQQADSWSTRFRSRVERLDRIGARRRALEDLLHVPLRAIGWRLAVRRARNRVAQEWALDVENPF